MAVTRRRFHPRDSSRRGIWVYLGVAVFVLVDILLIVWAVSSSRASAGGVSEEPSAGGIRPTASPSDEPAPAEEEAEQAEAAPTTTVAPTRILAALDGATAWRATTGTCPATPANPEITTDAGATWTVTDASGAGITAVQRIDVESAAIATVVGLSAEDCGPQVARTFVAGDDYNAYPELLATAWHLDPADPSTVGAPGGAVAAPCAAPVVVAPRDAEAAAVLCPDQTVSSTEDGGETWSEGTVIPGVLNLAETESGYIAVAAGARECAGVHVTQLDASLAPGTSGCLPLDVPASTLSGSVAIAQASEATWVWAGERVWRSSDGGATWQ